MITTTLNRIKAHSPCEDGWRKLLKYLNKTKADDEPLPYAEIVKSNGIDDALWCCRVEPGYDKEWRLFAVWCAKQVQHLMKDQRSINALDISEKYAHRDATKEELTAADAAAWNAADAAARNATEAAAWNAAEDAAWLAAEAAARNAAEDAADAAAWFVAWAAAMDAQKKEFLRIVG